MVYITGDCHGDWSRFSMAAFPEQKNMTKDDFVIICGDFGLWHDTPTERWWLKWLEEKSFTTLFVCGNHENFDRLYGNEFEVVDFHGGKAHKIRENIYHLMRGHIFDLCGKKFFAFGGASSHDINDGILDKDNFASEDEFYETIKAFEKERKMYRINHCSWWKQELPSEEEMQFGIDNLARNGNKVDFIISHCAPQQIAALISSGLYNPDKLTNYFDKISETVDFNKWFFGHYHDNRNVEKKYVLLYDQIVEVTKQGGRLC